MLRLFPLSIVFTVTGVGIFSAGVVQAQSSQFSGGLSVSPAPYYSPNHLSVANRNSPPQNGNASTNDSLSPSQRKPQLGGGQRPGRYYVANNTQVQGGEVIGAAGPTTAGSERVGYMAAGGPSPAASAPMMSTGGGQCSSCGGSAPGGCSSCGGGGPGGGVSGHGDYFPGSYFSSTCGMPQHMAYYPAMHGYYYFHPYHHTHVVYQQEFAGRFGLDVRNPYSNDFFKAIYAEYRASQREQGAESLPLPRPTGVYPQGAPTR